MTAERISRRSCTMLLAALSPPMFAARKAAAQGEEDVSRAPFGLTWGMSAEAVRTRDVVLERQDANRTWGASFSATKLTRVLSDTESVLLSFGHEDHLFRIAAIGRSNGPDPYGNATVSRYRELVDALSSRYGRGTEVDQRDMTMWKAANEYVMSLRQGRASRYTSFRTPATSVEISVRAQDSDKSFYVIIFTSLSGERNFEASNRRRERDAL